MIIGANVFQTMARLGSIEDSDDVMSLDLFKNAVAEIFDMGYGQVELITDPMLLAFSKEELKALMRDLADLGRSKNGKWSVHLPFWWVSPASLDEHMRRASVQSMVDVIELTRDLNPTHYVLHSISNIARFRNANTSQKVKDVMLQRTLDASKKSAAEIISHLDDSRQLCIENLTNVDFSWDLQNVTELDTSICFDIGHYFHRGGKVIEFLDRHFDRVRSIHAHNIIPAISEAQPKNWVAVDHFALGEGLMDNEKLMRWLVDKEYSGSLIVEVRSKTEGQKSIEFLRELEIVD